MRVIARRNNSHATVISPVCTLEFLKNRRNRVASWNALIKKEIAKILYGKAQKAKAPGLETDALSLYFNCTYGAILRKMLHKRLSTEYGALNLRTRNADIGKKMVVHCTEFTNCTATGYILLEFLTNVHLLTPRLDEHEIGVCLNFHHGYDCK